MSCIFFFFNFLSYHNILNVLLHQVVLGGNQYRPAKRIQIRVVQLVWHAIDFVWRLHVDVSDETQHHKLATTVNICVSVKRFMNVFYKHPPGSFW